MDPQLIIEKYQNAIIQIATATGTGTGFYVKEFDLIVTNDHVVAENAEVTIAGKTFEKALSRVWYTDRKHDLAFLEAPKNIELPELQLGAYEQLKDGDAVVAIGHPFGLNYTATQGVISKVDRIRDGLKFIQIDAAINPGNSGGALLNGRGELIGINDFIFSTSGGSQGIGFAIPAKMVRTIMDSMLTKGKVVRGYMGVSIQPLTADLVRQFNLTDKNGALLVDITEGGPAEKAGLQVGDVITEYDNRKIESMQELKNWVASTPPGKKVPVKVSRDGKTLSKTVIMGELAGQSTTTAPVAAASPAAPAAKTVENNLKGVAVRDVTDDILQKLGVKRKLRGVVITSITEDSPALGTLERGDIIIELNRKPVQSTSDFTQISSTIGKNQDILLLIVRGGASQYLTVSTR